MQEYIEIFVVQSVIMLNSVKLKARAYQRINFLWCKCRK